MNGNLQWKLVCMRALRVVVVVGGWCVAVLCEIT